MKKYVILIAIGIIGVFLLVNLCLEEFEINKIRISNSSVIGVVERVEEQSDSESGVNYKIIVKYLDVNDKVYYVSDRYNMPYFKYNIGDEIEVLYETLNPNNSIFKEDLYTPLIIFEFVLNILLSCLLFLGVYFYRNRKTE